jgi:hypothetical protein
LDDLGVARSDERSSSQPLGDTFVTQRNINDPQVQAIFQPSYENPPA